MKGKSCRCVAEETGVGKTQIQGIVKDKEAILKRCKDGERSDKNTQTSTIPIQRVFLMKKVVMMSLRMNLKLRKLLITFMN